MTDERVGERRWDEEWQQPEFSIWHISPARLAQVWARASGLFGAAGFMLGGIYAVTNRAHATPEAGLLVGGCGLFGAAFTFLWVQLRGMAEKHFQRRKIAAQARILERAQDGGLTRDAISVDDQVGHDAFNELVVARKLVLIEGKWVSVAPVSRQLAAGDDEKSSSAA